MSPAGAFPFGKTHERSDALRVKVGLVCVIGLVLRLMCNAAVPMDKAMETLSGALPRDMQRGPELLERG